ncbi:MAG: fumarate/nitrate reduction transcriptional regulator Fnr [Acidiferrobacterales bacterium]
MTKQENATVVSLASVKAACEGCSLRELCLPLGLGAEDLSTLSAMIKRTRKLKKGEYIYRMGESLTSLYAVRSGSAKTCEISATGEVQITGFHLAGELLGIDGISSERHHCDAVALEATEVCEIPFDKLEELAREIKGLQHQLFRILSREIVQDGELLLMLGKMNAEERLAACLLSFSRRFDQLGYSGTKFKLSMSRQDLGDYLGLALETVSRLFSRFHDEGLLAVDGRQICILDRDRLADLAGVAEVHIPSHHVQN